MSDTERIPFTNNFCFHPDIAEAAEQFAAGDKQAFTRAIEGHRTALKRGERFWEGDEGSDAALIDLVSRRTTAYQNRTGDVRPKTSEGRRKKFAENQKHWTDIPLGIRVCPEDEE